MKKFKNTWYIFTLVSIILALFFMVAYNYAMFKTSVVHNMEEIGSANLEKLAKELEAYLDTGKNVLQATTLSVEHMIDNGAGTEEIRDFLVYESKWYTEVIDKNFTGIYGLFGEDYIDGIGWKPGADYNPKLRDWYIMASQSDGEPVIVPPYVDAQTNTMMISVSEMLFDGESVLSLDISMDYIQKLTESISLNDLGYGFVIDKNGLVVAHNDINEKGKNYLETDSELKDLINGIYEQQIGCFRTKLNGRDVTAFSETVSEDWYVIMIVSNDVLFADAKTTLGRNIAICGIISLLIITFFVITFIRMNQSLEREVESTKRIEEMNRRIIRALVRTIDAKDRYTNGHSLRVAEYSKEIARRMNKSEKEQEEIYYAGLLHDVGKIRVPGSVINKPDKLTDEEFEQVKVHPVTGYHVLKDIYDDKMIANGSKFHHERYDGTGYPNGLKGEDIPEIARIVGVADAYDAMSSNRSYRKALQQDAVRAEIVKGKGTQLDPAIADIMIEMIDEDTSYSLKEDKSLQKNVLVVDDEPMNLRMVEHIMRDEPMYEIIGVGSGMEALEILETRDINLILLDLVMPKMDGFETLLRIKEKYDIPVVFMTGEKNIETLEKAAKYGVDDYITKPFLPLALREIVHGIAN